MAMSTTNAFFILFLLAAGLVLVVWIFLRGWSPEQMPLWAGLIWGLIGAMVFGSALLPASVRWSDSVSVVKGILGITMLALSIKCLILLLRHGSGLNTSQRYSAYLGIAPLIIGAIMVLFFFWMAGAFNAKK